MGPPGALPAGAPIVVVDEAHFTETLATLRADEEVRRWLANIETELKTLEPETAPGAATEAAKE